MSSKYLLYKTQNLRSLVGEQVVKQQYSCWICKECVAKYKMLNVYVTEPILIDLAYGLGFCDVIDCDNSGFYEVDIIPEYI